MADPAQAENSVQGTVAARAKCSGPFIAIAAATVILSAIFLNIAWPFLTTLILAGICAELSRPFYQWLLKKTGGRTSVTSALTLLMGTLIVILPLMVIAYLAVAQASIAIGDTDKLEQVIEQDLGELTTGNFQLPTWFPLRDQLEVFEPKIAEFATEIASGIASFLVAALSTVTSGTSAFILRFFVFLYALFFFLPMKTSVFAQALRYSGLPEKLQADMDHKILSVSRATIKGTLTIGVIQGALGALGFWAAGIDGAVFWGVVMTVFAAIPALGATPIVVSGAIFLGFQGEATIAVALGAWGIAVVGTIDNVLRPKLVGKGAGMSDLWIFISTLGGLAAFGASGLILGPVVAGLFLVIWQAVSGIRTGNDKHA